MSSTNGRITAQLTNDPRIRRYHFDYHTISVGSAELFGTRVINSGISSLAGSSVYTYLHHPRKPVETIVSTPGVVAITLVSPRVIEVEIDHAAEWEGSDQQAIEPRVISALKEFSPDTEGNIEVVHNYASDRRK